MCSADISSVTRRKAYTQKELALLKTLIPEFHGKYYITVIQKLAFHLSYVRIIGTHHCRKERCDSFKCWGEKMMF